MVFANQFYVFHENHDFRFSVWLIHFIIKSCSGSRVPRQKALISIRNGDRAGGATPTRPSTDSPLRWKGLENNQTDQFKVCSKIWWPGREAINWPSRNHYVFSVSLKVRLNKKYKYTWNKSVIKTNNFKTNDWFLGFHVILPLQKGVLQVSEIWRPSSKCGRDSFFTKFPIFKWLGEQAL